MYEYFISDYIGKLSMDDINNFCKKNYIILNNNELIFIYNLLKRDWKKVYKGNTEESFNQLKKNINSNAYLKIMNLYEYYKKKFPK